MAKKPTKEPEPPPNPVKLGYARVSTSDQDERMQIDALMAAGVLPENIYHERISGGAKFRPQYDLLMRTARRGDTVYAWKLDRLSRTASGLYKAAEELQQKGANLSILTVPGMDTSTPMGRAMFGMLAVFAEFEKAIAYERTMAGLKAARERGKFGGRTSKYKDDDILRAGRLGMKPGARKMGMSFSGFAKRYAVALANKAKADAAETQATEAGEEA